MKNRQALIKLLVVLVLGVLSIWFIHSQAKPHAISSLLRQLNPVYLIAAAVSFLLYLMMESLAFRYLLNRQGYHVKLSRTYGYSLADYFFSSISPGGSAGQPGQFYFMQRDHIRPAHIIMSLFSFNIVYHVAMLIIASWALLMGATQMIAQRHPVLKLLTLYGALAQIVMVLLLCFLMFSKHWVPLLLHKILAFLARFRLFRKLAAKQDTLDQHLSQHKTCGDFLKGNPIIFLRLLIYNIPLLFFSYSVPYWIYRAMGYHALSIWEIVAIQSVIVLALESLPIPGGVLATESVLFAIYAMLVKSSEAFGWMFLTRGFSFYLGLCLGGFCIISMRKEKLKRRTFKEAPLTAKIN